MSGPEPFPLTRSMRAYLDAFTRSILASKSTASDEERAAADDDRALAFTALVAEAGIDRHGEPNHRHGARLRHFSRAGRPKLIRPAA